MRVNERTRLELTAPRMDLYFGLMLGGGAVVNYDDLDLGAGLREDGLERLAKDARAIAGGDDNREEWHRSDKLIAFPKI